MTSDGGLPTEEDVRRERAARRTIEDQERRDPGCAWLTLAGLWTVLAAAVMRLTRRS